MSTAARVRLFVALELPEPVREAVARWRDRLPGTVSEALRPVARESLHVTLCFLGSRPEGEVEAIGAACGMVAAESQPSLVLREALWLPARRPRVLAVALDDRQGRLAEVQAALSAALAAGGWYEPEPRPYLAHVTVARANHRVRLRAVELAAPPRLEFPGSQVVLYRSRLSRGGARYEALRTVELQPQ